MKLENPLSIRSQQRACCLIQEGWFQRTNEGLMPVHIFDVELTEPKNGTVGPEVVVVNPEGDNSVLWQQGKLLN